MQTPTRFIFPSPSFSHYWETGRGAALKPKLTALPNLEEISSNIPLFYEVDSLADEIIREGYQKLGYKQTDAIVQSLVFQGLEKTIAAFEDIPACFKQLAYEISAVPTWLDWNLLEHGAKLCRRTGGFGLMVLRNYCLMGGYESAAINKPLIYTGALKKGASKRLTETTEFWINIIEEDTLKPGQNGVLSALKIRFMHAYARVQIKQEGKWDETLWGEPINQWDMLATNLGFSLVFLDGLRSLGFNPSDTEVTGLFHFWKYLGILMGIPASILPNTEEEAIRALYCWTMTQPAADEDTKALASALMLEPKYAVYPKKKWQKKLVERMHLGYNHYFLGATSCHFLGLPSSIFKHVPKLIRKRNMAIELKIHEDPEKYVESLLKSRNLQKQIVARFLPEIKNISTDKN